MERGLSDQMVVAFCCRVYRDVNVYNKKKTRRVETEKLRDKNGKLKLQAK